MTLEVEALARDLQQAACDDGVRFECADGPEAEAAAGKFLDRIAVLGLDALVEVLRASERGPNAVAVRLTAAALKAWTPDADTTRLCGLLGLDTTDPLDLEREIILSLLAAPQAQRFPSWQELAAHIRVRASTVVAARSAELDFHTTEVNRPTEFWTYVEGEGFVLNEGRRLRDALQASLRPGADGRYAFSCYRATEYVMLLGLVQELERSNPALLAALEARWRRSPIVSREFHDSFMNEQGSMEQPLPFKFYVPGDRVWFRNPDEASADVSGYEGSWVIYLGSGLFTNFWDASRPFTLLGKCLEVYHWRHGLVREAGGEVRIDESIVAAQVRQSLADEALSASIAQRMMRYRDPSGVYAEGGCIDRTREQAFCLCPESCSIRLA